MTKITDSKTFAAEMQAMKPGAYLKQVREEKGVSAEYLIRQLGLTNTLFGALEADEFDRLPGPVYVRGYLRRYAEIVDERPAPVLAAYQRYLEASGLVEMPPQEEPPQRPVKVMIASALGFLLATSLVFGAILSEEETVEEMPPETVQKIEAAPRQAIRQVPTTEQLGLEFTTDSWVEVVDSRDHILAVSLQREGTELALEGKPPFSVTLGYGPGVDVSYMGETIAFDHDPETFSATFTVGK